MNDLNSILIEGYNIDTPIDGIFTLLSKRNNCGQWEGTAIRIKTTFKLKESIMEKMINEGVNVRVVGRIVNDHKGIYIYAEHIEFKHTIKNKQLNLF